MGRKQTEAADVRNGWKADISEHDSGKRCNDKEKQSDRLGEEVLMRSYSLVAVAALGVALPFATPASAHCDGLDGPVVGAARKAFEAGDANPVLIWVQPQDEAEVRRAFAEAIAVRKLNSKARGVFARWICTERG